eukprot:Rhum_TRINITY_DN19355_c0_g1::Rhum_TRINITY_DN19355_c0_g1_i1::g.169835::m.169835
MSDPGTPPDTPPESVEDEEVREVEDVEDEETSRQASEARDKITEGQHVPVTACSDNDPEYEFSGMMRDGKKNGPGKLVFKYGVYEGNFVNDMMEGQGRLELKTGNVYDGEFVRSRFEGRGVLRWRNGREYVGMMRSGNMMGRGKLTSKDGEYEGDFYHNEFFGKGVMRFANGDVYDGEWKQDMMWGAGTLVTHEKTVYKGAFYKNQKHGRMTRTCPKGKTYSERYDHDQRLSSFKVKGQKSSAVGKFLSKVISSPASQTVTTTPKSGSLFDRPECSREDVARHLDRRAKSNRHSQHVMRHPHNSHPVCTYESDESDHAVSEGAASQILSPHAVSLRESSQRLGSAPQPPICSSADSAPLSLDLLSQRSSQRSLELSGSGAPPPLPPCPPPPSAHFSTFKGVDAH